MPYAGLHSANAKQMFLTCTWTEACCPNRASFNGIAERRPSTMCLEALNICLASFSMSSTEQCPLSLTIWSCEAYTLAILPNCHACEMCHNAGLVHTE